MVPGVRRCAEGAVCPVRGRPRSGAAESTARTRLLARDEQFVRVVAGGLAGPNGLELRAERRWRTPGSLLLPIGQALARGVSQEDFTNVKACQGSTCTLLFADHTRSRARRWCSMATCGNRAKQETHRNRAKAPR
ncbi:CGNR zinc finger domain-containing protein [Streptomyces sp. NPDC020800]|uniref:CGNR zinc finger domain-containing protein n=1 Tax=Streptomyces sp. NPDC020800 TaxID=3365092 RepID=UPI00378B020E